MIGRDYRPCLIVKRKFVGPAGPVEAHLHHVDLGRNVVDDRVGTRLRIERQVARLEQHPVAVDLQPALRGLDVQVRDAHEDRSRHARRGLANRKGDDRLVPSLTPDRQDLDLVLEPGCRSDGEGRVRGNEDLGVIRSRGQRVGEVQRVAEVAARGLDRQSLDRRPDAAEVGRGIHGHTCRPAGRDHADLPTGGQVPERVESGGLGNGQSVRRDVGRPHAGGCVDDQHQVPGQSGRSLQERSRGKGREQQDQQQLEEEEQAPTQALPGSVCLDVGDELAPQQRGRDDLVIASKLEQVHRHHGRQEQEPEQGQGGDEAHRQPTTWRRRNSANMRSLRGTSLESGT